MPKNLLCHIYASINVQLYGFTEESKFSFNHSENTKPDNNSLTVQWEMFVYFSTALLINA